MALRVLLADESNTIKKVFQLALQDYAVEVRPVNIGLDVIPVAKQFQPDIVFADVLLQKRSGYDVSADIKAEDELKDTPVVLMWSGFMELDEDKYQASGASAHLEKPFDVNALRKIVQSLVPKTKTQKLSGYLSFPDMPEFEENQPANPVVDQDEATVVHSSDSTAPPENSQWNMDSFESIEETVAGDDFSFSDSQEDDFQQISLNQMKGPGTDEAEATEPPPPPSQDESLLLDDSDDDEEDGAWTRRDISRFKIQIEDDDTDDVPVAYNLNDDQVSESDFEFQDEPTAVKEAPAEPSPSASQGRSSSTGHAPQTEASAQATPGAPSQNPTTPSQAQIPQLSPEKLEEIIRAQSKEVIESVVWKVVPELAKQLIERELQRLLDEKDNQFL